MGYTTESEGAFHLDRPLDGEHWKYLMKFSRTRRMKRHRCNLRKKQSSSSNSR